MPRITRNSNSLSPEHGASPVQAVNTEYVALTSQPWWIVIIALTGAFTFLLYSRPESVIEFTRLFVVDFTRLFVVDFTRILAVDLGTVIVQFLKDMTMGFGSAAATVIDAMILGIHTIYGDFSIQKLVLFCGVAVFVSFFPTVGDAVAKMLSKAPKA